MTITCPTCGTSYALDPATFPPEGRTLRCAKCRSVWHADAPDTASTPAATPDASPAIAPAAEQLLPPDDQAPGGEMPDEGMPDAGIPGEGTPDEPVPVSAKAAPPASPIGARLIDDDDDIVADRRIAGSDDAGGDEHAPPEALARDAARRAGIGRRGRRGARGGLRTGEAMLIGAALAGTVAALYYREDIVRSVPASAAIYEAVGLPVNLRGLEFVNLKQRRDFEDGVPVLILEGEIVNVRGEAVAMPAIRFGLRSRGGEEVYAWTVEPRQRVMEPTGAMPFRTRLASPPRTAETVQIRFTERGRRIVEAQQ